MKQNNIGFYPAEILLPQVAEMDKWAVVACDQFTSQPEYWQAVEQYVGEEPSALRLMLPEAKLNDPDVEKAIAAINTTMNRYLEEELFAVLPQSLVYLERTQSDGKIRRGMIGVVDLEHYDYNKGSRSLIRATEGTVMDRLPPRLAVRRDAMLELPHAILLIDDPGKTVIEPIGSRAETLPLAYSFQLMHRSGKVEARFVDSVGLGRIEAALQRLISPEQIRAKYGEGVDPLLFAVGDGNHSLACAKIVYEEIKKQHGDKNALYHPARYTLVEIVNLHDPALQFEPIYRVLQNVDPDDVLSAMEKYSFGLHGGAEPQQARFLSRERRGTIHFGAPCEQLVAGTLQTFIDGYLASHPEASVDYIHGSKRVEVLSAKDNTVGFLYGGLDKSKLFTTVIKDGALPRKTFSMGTAADKRFYVECRRIK